MMRVITMMSAVALATMMSAVALAEALTQYTPDLAGWTTAAFNNLGNNGKFGHHPRSVWWVNWDEKKYQWDGTIFNPETTNRFADEICPHVDVIRGIEAVFDKTQPFADINNPTTAEIDNWHRIAINHVRALVGYTEEDRQIKNDVCISAGAVWQNELQYGERSEEWKTDKCAETNSSQHCGFKYVASEEIAKLYLTHAPDTVCNRTRDVGQAEGIFPSPKMDIPWSVKFSRGFCNNLKSEGFWGGHTGPWFHRSKFGFAFWNHGAVATLRGSWGGDLIMSKYIEGGDGTTNDDSASESDDDESGSNWDGICELCLNSKPTWFTAEKSKFLVPTTFNNRRLLAKIVTRGSTKEEQIPTVCRDVYLYAKNFVNNQNDCKGYQDGFADNCCGEIGGASSSRYLDSSVDDGTSAAVRSRGVGLGSALVGALLAGLLAN